MSNRFKNGIFRKNVVLMSGLVTASVIAGATDFISAEILAVGFTLVTFFGVALCRLVPKKLIYTVRIIIYALIAAAVYIPVYIVIVKLFGSVYTSHVGVYLPVIVCNPLILSKTETRFARADTSFGKVMSEIGGYIVGFDLVCLLTGTIRDIFANNAVGWLKVPIGFDVPALETSFGGFILLGILAALLRKAVNR